MNNQALGVKTKAALDWLTVTSKTLKRGNRLYDIYSAHKDGETKHVNFFGFQCLRDNQGLTWGKRAYDGCYILIAPGETAAQIWPKLAPIAPKVTRIDLACDVWLEEPRDQVRQSARVPMSPAHSTRTKATLITGIRGGNRVRDGDTLYLGSRQSTQYGRMYDKGLQQQTSPPGQHIRYETEYKGAAAMQIAKEAHRRKPGQFGEWIRCTVFDWFMERSVIPLFKRETETPGTKIRVTMKQTSPERKLVWLRTQIRPTVKHLFEQGLRDETLAALGMEIVKVDKDGYTVISDGLPSEKIAV